MRARGGQFTRLKDGETVERGPYGVAAIDTRSGKVLWQYKGADKGITNIVLTSSHSSTMTRAERDELIALDSRAIAVADHDELITIDAASGKRLAHLPHQVKGASFALVNERGEVSHRRSGRDRCVRFRPRGLARSLSAAGPRFVAHDWRHCRAGCVPLLSIWRNNFDRLSWTSDCTDFKFFKLVGSGNPFVFCQPPGAGN